MNWKTLVKRFLIKRNTILSKPPGQFSITDFKLEQIKRRGLDLKVIIDGGAASGGFAIAMKQIFPESTVVMIEPRADVQKDLADLVARTPGLVVASTLIGPSVGEVEFFLETDRSSILGNASGNPYGQRVKAPMTTLDLLLEERKLVPDMIKLDLQGAELQALAGATRSLAAAQAVLLEASLIELQKGTPLLVDVLDFMREHGFQLYDVFALWHRPLDGALAQGDFFFLKHDHPLLADKRWSTEG